MAGKDEIPWGEASRIFIFVDNRQKGQRYSCRVTTKLFFGLFFVPQVLLAAPSIVFENVQVVPMDRETVLQGMTLVVEDGRITALGKSDRVSIPPDARRVEGRGRFLLPGLVEMHAHLRERASLGLYLAHGFTTVRDMNGRLGDTLTWRDEVDSGLLDGPRIFAGGVTLYVDAPDDYPHPVRTPDEARRAVREIAARGYDLIKVYRLEREPYFALMDEARTRGIPVAGHYPDVVHSESYEAPLDITVDDVLASGIVSIEHLDELINAGLRMKLDREAIAPLARKFRAHGVAVTTILRQDFLVQQIRREKQAYLTVEKEREIRTLFGADAIEKTRQQIDFIATKLPRAIADLGTAIPEFSLLMLRIFQEEGVELLIGTDSHSPLVPAGRSGLDEMELFIDAGLRPYDALRAATFNAAHVLGELDELGTVTVGKRADLLLVEANPLESLAPLRHPLGVMRQGRFYDRVELESLLAAAKPESQ